MSDSRSLLVGRSAEFERLEALLEQAESGHGGMALLIGEAGAGKTSLARAVADAAAPRAFRVGWGRGTTHGGAPPYWILTQALQPLLDGPGAADAISSAALFELLPEARMMRPDLAAVSFTDAQTAQFAIARSVARFLGRLGREQSVLVVLDDLQDADISSLRVLELLCAELPRIPAVVLATARERDWSDAPVQRDVLAGLLRAGTTIEVERLSQENTAELLRRHSAADDDLVARVHEATSGNALFVTELARALASTPGKPPTDLPIPIGIREFVRQRLCQRPEHERQALAAAAVLGLDAAETEVRAVTDAPVPAELDLASVRNGRVCFSHGLVREGVYATLPEDERRALHRRAADVVAEHDVGRSQHARRAYHLSRGGPDCAHEAARAALHAADVASAGGAFDDALALLDGLHVDALGPSMRLDVLLATGRAALQLGDGPRGRELVTTATELARDLHDSGRLAEAALVRGSVFSFAQVDPQLVSALEEALDQVGEDEPALRSRLLARYASARQPSEDPYATAEDGLAAIELARSIGDEHVLLEVLYTAMAAAFEYAAPARRRPLNRECVQLAQRRGNITIEWRARTRLLFDAFELGDLDEADAMIAELHRLANTLGQDSYRHTLAMIRAMRALFLGHFDDADRARRDAVALGGDGPMQPFIQRFHLIGVHRTTRDIESLRAVGQEIFGMLTAAGFHEHARQFRATIDAATGDGQAVSATLKGVLERRFLQERPLAIMLAEGADALSEEQARTLYAWFAPHAGEFPSTGATGFYIDLPVDHALALIASRLEEHADALTHLDNALTLVRRAGARPHVVRALVDGARIHRAADSEATAQQMLAEAHELARGLAVATLVDYVEAAGGHRAKAEPSFEETAELSLTRIDDDWVIALGRKSVRLKHNVGLDVLDALMRRPSEEIHVLELMGVNEPGSQTESIGDLLDPRAKAEYKRRLDELGDEIAAARARGRAGRAEALESERVWLVRELAAAFGLGGKARPVGSTAEKARVTVQRRVRRAIDKIREQDDEIAALLDASVKTGTYCSYHPLPLKVVTM